MEKKQKQTASPGAGNGESKLENVENRETGDRKKKGRESYINGDREDYVAGGSLWDKKGKVPLRTSKKKSKNYEGVKGRNRRAQTKGPGQKNKNVHAPAWGGATGEGATL